MAAVLVLSDQTVKHIFSDSSRFYCNPVGPWGIPVDNGALIAVILFVLVSAGYLFPKSSGAPFGIAFALLFAGGISNLLDRILFGCVRDFALVYWFPAFNLADTLLTVGAMMFLFASLQRKTPLE